MKSLSKMDCLVLGFFIGVIFGILLQFLPPSTVPPTTGTTLPILIYQNLIDRIFMWIFLVIFTWYIYKLVKTHGKEKDNRNS